jgi:4-hydroxyproline epimerase
MAGPVNSIRVIDSHTGGEPTRIIVAGGPELGVGTMAERRAIFRDQHDDIRTAVIGEPRGSEVLVGALLCDPVDQCCSAGVVFFNNHGVLHMCGHGTIGLMATLAWLNRITPGVHRIETPVGIVTATLHDNHRVSVQNVSSHRFRKAVSVVVPGLGTVTGDVAWGGNWFFLCSDHGQQLTRDNTRVLVDVTLRIREALHASGVTGTDDDEIDHVELFGPPSRSDADSRNFVLCPGGAWDRSPCGTGTSAKLACLAADGKLSAGSTWRQESIIGSVFEATWQPDTRPGQAATVIPTITGSAWVTADTTLVFGPTDPFCTGIPE